MRGGETMKTSSFRKFLAGLLGAVLAAACGLLEKPNGERATVAPIASSRSALGESTPISGTVTVTPTAVYGISEAIPVMEPQLQKFCNHRKLDGACIRPAPDDEDADGFPAGVDCNDHDPYVYPGAFDAKCNNVDEDCDGEDFCPSDPDGDGYSGPADCDEKDPRRHWDAPEISCNGIDENCDGVDWCDADGDGEPATVDCNDKNATISRQAKEIMCDGIDQNCDGSDCCANDADGDGAPCSADCDDNDPNTYPGAPVTPGCHGKDIDCDGIIDGFCHH
jgi:hypothetical protein